MVGVGFLDLEETGTPVAVGMNRFHVYRLVVLVFQDISQLPERRERHPACLGGARSRNTMALALQTLSLLKDLHQRGKSHNKHMIKKHK